MNEFDNTRGITPLLLKKFSDKLKDKIKEKYVTKEEIDGIHSNLDVLDLLSTDGKDLYFNGKNVQKIELQDGQYGYSATILNVITDNIYTIDITNGSTLCEQIVQVWEFEEGTNDITTIAKTFNNVEKNNFYYNSENIEFTEVCKIKDEFILENELDSSIGLYETKVNKADFVDLVNLRSEVYK